MKFDLILIAAVGFLASIVNAGIETTSPYNAITWTGGNVQNVTWKDDGSPPQLSDPSLKKVVIQLMTGNNKQIVVDTIAKGVSGTAQIVKYTVPKTVGPSGNFYFIKYTAGTYEAYSGRFSIQGINGTIPGFDPNAPLSDPNNTTAPANNTSDSSSSSSDSTTSGGSGDDGTTASGTSPASGTGTTSSLATPTKPANSTKQNSSSDASPRVFLQTSLFASLALGVVAIVMTFM